MCGWSDTYGACLVARPGVAAEAAGRAAVLVLVLLVVGVLRDARGMVLRCALC